MAFTASAISRVIVGLGDMFPDPNANGAGLMQKAVAANFLLQNQRARVDEILTGGQCTGVKAWYFRSPGTTEGVDAPTTCATPTGAGGETLSVNFDTAHIAGDARHTIDPRCDQDINFFALETRRIVSDLLDSVRAQTNEYILTAAAAAAQPNLSSFLPTDWDDTSDTPRVLVPDEDFVWENIWQFRQMLAQNYIGPDALMLDSGNFYGDTWLQNYLRANNLGAGSLAFQEFNMAFDLMQMAGILGRPSTLAVDRNSYVFWNSTWSSFTPTHNDSSTFPKWTWVVADPILKYWKNGSLVPVLYEVEMVKTCNDRIDQTTQLQYRYDYYARLIGGFEFVPAGVNGETGVMEHFNFLR
jgi:hypothetical protein